MTHPDDFGRRGAAAGIIDLGDQRPRVEPRVQRPAPPPISDAEAARMRDLAAALQPTPRKATELEEIAKWLIYLPYGDMKQLATEVLADQKPDTPIALADLLHSWAKRKEIEATGAAA